MFGRVFDFESKHRTVRQIPIRYTKQFMYKTKYAVLHHSGTYTNVYIGIGSTCMYKRHFNRIAFVKARVAQSVEHQARHFKVVGSSPTVGSNISFYILSRSTRSWQVDWSHTNEIKHNIHPR